MKNSKVVLLWITLIVLVLFTAYMFYIKETTFCLYSILFILFDVIFICKSMFVNNPDKKYNSAINNILKTYDCILVEIEVLPDLTDKKLIITQSFQDIANTEYEIRKPVYYLNNENGYDFLLIDKDEVYTYTIRKEENLNTHLDLYIKERNIQEMQLKKEQEVIGNLDKTAIIRINGEEEYKVSPIRKKEV